MTFARFGDTSYKYGNTARLYGAGADTTDLLWALQIDWDGDGVFDGSNEAIYMTGCSIKRGRDFYIKVDGDGKASGFEPMKVGRIKITMDNSSGRFDPYNASSPLYPYILPGRYLSLSVLYNGTLYPRFAGKITDIQAVSDDDYAVIMAEDGLRRLQDFDASIAVQQDIDIDDAIGMVLDDVDYPTIWGRSLEDTSDILDYWWSDDRAKTEIQRLADAELGNFFIAADGMATFYSRHHTTTPLLTLTSADFLKRIEIPQPWEVVRNSIKVTAHPPELVTGQAIWQMVDKPSIPSGNTFTVWASYSYNNVPVSAINAIEPVATTDFTVNTEEDGSGDDLTASCVITSFIPYGKTAKISLKNNSAFNGFVTLLKVRGDAITFPDPSIQIAEDTASQAIYDPRTFSLDSQWMQSTSRASDFSQYLVSFLSTPQKFLIVQMEGRPDNQVVVDLLDTIDTTITKLGVDDSFRIGSIDENWLTENGQSILSTWVLEPFPDVSGFWQFTATIGVTTVFGI